MTVNTPTDTPKYRFADLYGILAGKSNSSDADITACEYGVYHKDDLGKD